MFLQEIVVLYDPRPKKYRCLYFIPLLLQDHLAHLGQWPVQERLCQTPWTRTFWSQPAQWIASTKSIVMNAWVTFFPEKNPCLVEFWDIVTTQWMASFVNMSPWYSSWASLIARTHVCTTASSVTGTLAGNLWWPSMCHQRPSHVPLWKRRSFKRTKDSGIYSSVYKSPCYRHQIPKQKLLYKLFVHFRISRGFGSIPAKELLGAKMKRMAVTMSNLEIQDRILYIWFTGHLRDLATLTFCWMPEALCTGVAVEIISHMWAVRVCCMMQTYVCRCGDHVKDNKLSYTYIYIYRVWYISGSHLLWICFI